MLSPSIHYCDIKEVVFFWRKGPFEIKFKAEREKDCENYYQAIFLNCRRAKWTVIYWRLGFIYKFSDGKLHFGGFNG